APNPARSPGSMWCASVRPVFSGLRQILHRPLNNAAGHAALWRDQQARPAALIQLGSNGIAVVLQAELHSLYAMPGVRQPAIHRPARVCNTASTTAAGQVTRHPARAFPGPALY